LGRRKKKIEKFEPFPPDDGGEKMLPSREVINHLLELGLNKYEAKVYLTLVEEGTSTAKNVSDITGIPYGKVYEIINSLCAKGFSHTLPTKPMKCKALSPTDILNNVREKTMAKFDALEDVFEKELVPAYALNKKFDDPKNVMWIVNGRSNINKKIESMVAEAKKSVNGMKRLAFQKTVLREAHDRGVSITIICNRTKDNAEDCDLLNFCEIHNPRSSISNGFVSIDSREAILIDPLPDDDNIMRGRDIGMWVTSRNFTEFLEKLIVSQANCRKNGRLKMDELTVTSPEEA
jgi:sugar-specific transcriptional regulator TrmB